MRNIILITLWGNFDKRKIQSKHILEKYYVGHTVNGVPKYKWNIYMWFKTILNN